jgi:hypothetical protein
LATVTRHGKGWRVQVRHKGMEPLSETFPLKKQADAWGALREAEYTQGKLGLLPKHTLGEALGASGWRRPPIDAAAGGKPTASRSSRTTPSPAWRFPASIPRT